VAIALSKGAHWEQAGDLFKPFAVKENGAVAGEGREVSLAGRVEWLHIPMHEFSYAGELSRSNQRTS
jgi:hypothetical protein